MKQILLVMMMAIMLLPSMISCSQGNDEEPKRYATESEIQGYWVHVGQPSSYVIVFSKPSYTIYMESNKKTELESGHYTMGTKGTINLTPTNGKESPWSPLEAYWDGPTNSSLHLWPLGSFYRSK